MPGITMTVVSVSQRPASHFFESPASLVSPDCFELQQATTVFFAEQQADEAAFFSFASIAHNRSNHSGGWTPLATAQASFSDCVRQPQPDQQAWALRHEHLQSIHGNATDRSFITGLGIEITKPLAIAHTNSNADMSRRLRIG
ncbi:MAG TPA: hypothetical protein DDZ51_28130 [Planctomycetaceae bacterium]|nr:hypothetical protein [Planctomycetaceae bacterium]